MSQIFTSNSTSTGDNILATEDNEFIFVAEGVTRASEDRYGLNADGFYGLEITVLGTVVGGSSSGMYLNNSGADVGDYQVTIGETGTVIGDVYGVHLRPDTDNSIVNHGQIIGGSSGVYSLGDDFTLMNTGLIQGGVSEGVLSTGSGGSIVNEGVIHSEESYGVQIYDNDSAEAVVLRNYGTISTNRTNDIAV